MKSAHLLYSISYFVIIILLLAPMSQTQILLCVDAGHGGNDHGTCAATSLDTTYCENELNLSIMKILRDTLLYEYLFTDSCDIFYTRYTDTFLPLQRRAFLADSVGARSFISIHHNSLGPIIQRTETFYCSMMQTPADDSWDPERIRDTDTSLATVLALRLNDKLGFGFGSEPAKDNCFIVLKYSAMASALTEAYSISDTAVADAMILNDDHIREKEASALAKGWYAYYEGVQGIAIVQYEYLDLSYNDVTQCYVQVGLGNDPVLQNIPYQGCWLLNEYVMLYAEDIDAVYDSTRTFHHWEWRDFSADTLIYRYNDYQRQVDFFVSPSWADSTHYYRAYFTGGSFNLNLNLPIPSMTKIYSDSVCLIAWSAPEGILRSCSLYVDYSSDSMQNWANIIGPVPYNYGFVKNAMGRYDWDVPDIEANNCYLRLRAYDYLNNTDTLISHRFKIGPSFICGDANEDELVNLEDICI